MGPIVDRTKEHLGSTDQPVVVARALLLDAQQDVEDERLPRGADPRTHHDVRAADTFIPAVLDWQ